MPEVEKVGDYYPVGERMYILGFIHAMLAFGHEFDDPVGVLDDAIDSVLIDAFKFGWLSKANQKVE